MKVTALIRILSNVYIKYGDMDVIIAPQTLMPHKAHKIPLSTEGLYVANKKTIPELHIKLYL